jgi:hypothetical protein
VIFVLPASRGNENRISGGEWRNGFSSWRLRRQAYVISRNRGALHGDLDSPAHFVTSFARIAAP